MDLAELDANNEGIFPDKALKLIKIVTIALGFLWVLDGALQFQPTMYSHSNDGFVATVLQYNTMGPPNFLTNLIHFAVVFTYGTQLRTNIFNSLAGTFQILIGVGIITKRFRKIALVASSIWAIVPWIVGEGMGQMPWPQTSMAFNGAPGAALIYCVISLVLIPSNKRFINQNQVEVAAAHLGFLGDNFVKAFWFLTWFGTALLEFEPGNWAPQAVSTLLKNSASGEPYLLYKIDLFVSHLAAGNGALIAGSMAFVQAWIGFAVTRSTTRRAAVILGIMVSVIYWVVGQNLGGIFTGTATDPQLGAPMLLLALLLYPVKTQQVNFGKKHSKVLVSATV